MLDWLIVGGGPHGIHMACRLLDRDVDPQKIAILDPHLKPLARWSHHTANTGMLHLRSPGIHNLDSDPLSLGRHAETEAFTAAKHGQSEPHSASASDFIPPYSRPSLRLFMHHVQSLVETKSLMRLWRCARADTIQALEHGYCVRTDTGDTVEANHVVLALGAGDQPNWPRWALPLKSRNSQVNVRHIFDPDFKREQIDDKDDVAIVGAGISAAQLALSLLRTNSNRQITLISRHFLRREDFDSDPGWLGPTLLEAFHRERCYSRRRTIIREARHTGSLASEVNDRLQTAILRERSIVLELAEVDGADYSSRGNRLQLHIRPIELDSNQYQDTGEIVVQFSKRAQILEADTVVLATGFESRRPGGKLVDDAIQDMHLPTAEDGFPIVDRHLSWRRGLFVMGPLAELEVGPASRNLSGARMAAERIVHSGAGQNSSRRLAAVPTCPELGASALSPLVSTYAEGLESSP